MKQYIEITKEIDDIQYGPWEYKNKDTHETLEIIDCHCKQANHKSDEFF